MYPQFFGPPDQQLYGVLHLPEAGADRGLGAVLCQPILHEAADCHRALRALADRLARAGVHVLRFDYGGTGDSAGDQESVDPARWRADIEAARTELRESRGLDAVGLVGLRFGATLAAEAAAAADDVPFVVLWEPVTRGRPYVEGLRELQEAWLHHESAERPSARRHATPHEVFGHPFGPQLSDGLEATDLVQLASLPAPRVLLVDEGCGTGLDTLRTHLAGLDGGRLDHRRVDGGQIWQRAFDGEQARVPRALVDEIVGWIIETAAAEATP